MQPTPKDGAADGYVICFQYKETTEKNRIMRDKQVLTDTLIILIALPKNDHRGPDNRQDSPSLIIFLEDKNKCPTILTSQ
jgi:hypothetical protein